MLKENKIKNLDDLAGIIEKQRGEEKVVVHCHGVFDLLHIGHIRHFEQAKQMGDILVVTITTDQYVDKGQTRPAFPEVLRAEAIASLGMVNYVAVNPYPTAEETLRLLHPDIYVKGSEFKEIFSDMTGKIAGEAGVAKELGIKIAFTEDIVFSSTNLINKYLSNLPEELDDYLRLFRQRNSLEQVMDILDRMSSLRVLVIGDTILDEYQYCEVMGKSSKDPVLAVKYQSNDIFAGGVLAVANHVAGFADNVTLVTVLGDRDSHEDFIRSSLIPNISTIFAYQKDAPTLIKRRFVDGYSLNKLFEVYIMDDSGLDRGKEAELCSRVKDHLDEYDVVIAADYGHGAISENLVDLLSKHSKFLAVSVQSNSGNRGFHTISRYPRADYASIAEHEIRLDLKARDGVSRAMMEQLSEKLRTSQFVVTRGKKGCLVVNNKMEFVDVPAFARNAVDRVGAGDAFFSVTALASALGASNEMLGFIGNVAGGQAVSIIGNKESVNKLQLKKHITAIIK